MKNILLAVTGGIAAYKAIDLTSKLTQSGYQVRVMLTEHAKQFVTPLAFQAISRNHVYIDTFDEKDVSEIQHITLADWADAVIVAPATANTISKLANGLADNMVTSTLLATTAPVFIAPAMNVHMLEHPSTVENMSRLRNYGYKFIAPGEGYLACGYVARGRMEEPITILTIIDDYFKEQAQPQTFALKGKNVLVTAGPTVEKVDAVRYFTNRSSGKMGYALAEAARDLGANVTLVSGETNLTQPVGVEFVQVTSAEDMFQAVKSRMNDMDMIIKAAAVADYTPVETSEHKMKKKDGDLQLTFKRTTDILKYLGEHKDKQYLVGFAAETDNVEEYAMGKLKKKNADVIVANHVANEAIGFRSSDNEVDMYFANGDKVPIAKASKQKVAIKILNEITSRWED
ncbi:bifunctional phosphopantothenoylcysteine decarboxylase/phosphopantothenate--cysteine ligase CoaBC [Mammaliicoccus sciuri]|jgi:phosphopantothenoylcysteine decarboxylase/phosphopantothenate--cysteine ligase|uniref:bifunctional phosphopantothenoylcysteine decarboxylase/phosphopantothenate--cysteine ligase CoaBC n=1 Tax=Mammaliicoccus sciuri TaxID=1296 RepID=UPI000878BE1A|nr:bifunctional phosphopantothenoylcysteine decarboxylase/phosphopantothenate--cysteine ligase CoaBC [Mammaliicoccus sciuri]MBF0718990.1 bifunctional phosphopantothenoylcysteine decarboxylase/phosphopantothenate--cysteine ligase CoaBC [Mammaliicoccus sciuri]MBG9205443.1 bifunctional phosphopantothenoylcysteine decarboxylase/phosphopantothenate--cysteine ligase CoaBC [Mammaliicoccus sciuri]MBU6088235.1 bifunctional phosphopantothenoylcysteine decarboxylase/phosphopantothenate--cysteine ligase Coa